MDTIDGKIYHISLDHKTIFNGWYAIKDKQDNIYLLERHFSLNSNFWRNLYTTDTTFENIIIKADQVQRFKQPKSHFRLGSIGLAIIVGSLVRQFLPIELFFGQFNSSFDLKIGISNVITTLLISWISIHCLFWYRKFLIKRKFSNVRKLGSVKLLTPLFVLKNGKEFW